MIVVVVVVVVVVIVLGDLKEIVLYSHETQFRHRECDIYKKGKVIPLQARCGPEGG